MEAAAFSIHRRPGGLLIVALLFTLGLGRVQRSASAALPPEPGSPTGECTDGPQASGAVYRICMPAGGTWNGELVVFAHGYVAFNAPVGIPEDQLTLPDGTYLPDIVTGLGFAFAMSGYRVNGLAVVPGIADLIDVVSIFESQHGVPGHVYLVGASEGGLITALAVENHPEVFDGGLAACGPIGDFGGQVDYFGDFRVVFDYFYPGLLPPNPVAIPDWLINAWDSYYPAVVQPNVFAPGTEGLIDQLLAVSGAAFDPADPATREATVQGLLWYNVFATNDGVTKLGGQPFDNLDRQYRGSLDDARLNAWVQRYAAAPAARAAIEAGYQTRGLLPAPLVTLHTTGDPIVPYWHAIEYRGKVINNDALGFYRHVRVDRYGHCQFEALEVLNAFLQLVDMVVNPPVPVTSQRVYLPVGVVGGS